MQIYFTNSVYRTRSYNKLNSPRTSYFNTTFMTYCVSTGANELTPVIQRIVFAMHGADASHAKSEVRKSWLWHHKPTTNQPQTCGVDIAFRHTCMNCYVLEVPPFKSYWQSPVVVQYEQKHFSKISSRILMGLERFCHLREQKWYSKNFSNEDQFLQRKTTFLWPK